MLFKQKYTKFFLILGGVIFLQRVTFFFATGVIFFHTVSIFLHTSVLAITHILVSLKHRNHFALLVYFEPYDWIIGFLFMNNSLTISIQSSSIVVSSSVLNKIQMCLSYLFIFL